MKEDDRPEWYHQVRVAAAMMPDLSGTETKHGAVEPTVDGCKILHQLVTIGNYETL